MICINDEDPLNMFFTILLIPPVIVNVLIPSNTSVPNDATEGGIEICVNDEQPLKALSPIEVTEEGIVICFNDMQ